MIQLAKKLKSNKIYFEMKGEYNDNELVKFIQGK